MSLLGFVAFEDFLLSLERNPKVPIITHFIRQTSHLKLLEIPSASLAYIAFHASGSVSLFPQHASLLFNFMEIALTYTIVEV